MIDETNQKHKDYLFPCVANYYKEPLVLERGEGCYLFGKDGKKYLDFFGGILTVSVGHCNPKVTSKINEQINKEIDEVINPEKMFISLYGNIKKGIVEDFVF